MPRSQTVREVLSDPGALVRTVGFRDLDGAALVQHRHRFRGLGPARDHASRPAQLRPFSAIQGVAHNAPSTPGDLLFHIRAERDDLCFEFEKLLLERAG